MQLVSVNCGQPRTIRFGGRQFCTGIDKRPAATRIRVSRAGLAGDSVVDGDNHGGPDQAVYAYGVADYAWWSRTLDRDLEYGTFGENLTIDALPDDLCTGDRLVIGDVVLEATAPRIPCSKLAAVMQDPTFGLRFRRAERPGFYFRVLNGGDISAGDSVVLAENAAATISMLELFRLAYERHPDAAELQRALEAPLAERLRQKFERRLAAATA